jgi:hypothetical protein
MEYLIATKTGFPQALIFYEFILLIIDEEYEFILLRGDKNSYAKELYEFIEFHKKI